jgi:hypothetical protein
MTVGYYHDDHRVSFLYPDEPAPIDTWRHEIVHQLLRENGGSRSIADAGQAWMVEGIAMYFESFRDHGEYVTLGGFDSERLQLARLRYTREGFFVPLEDVASLDRAAFQELPDLHAHYSQAAGVCQFLFTGEGGRYRDGLIGFVRDFYRGRGDVEALAEATAPLDQLDRGYVEFLKLKPGVLEFLEPGAQTGLALHGAGLRGDDLAVLAKCTRLEWLQLTENPLDDAGLAHLVELPLRELMLDITPVGDAGMEFVADMETLEQLDVANTRITDKGVASIARLPELQVLWLAGTGVTDAGLAQLESLSRLKYVDLRGTGVSDQGVARLRAKLPDLQVER